MTMASLGRSTKMADSIVSAPLVEGGLKRGSAHSHTGAHGLESLYDDLLTAVEPGFNSDSGANSPGRFDTLHDGLAVLHHEYVSPLLVGDEGGLRHHDLLFCSVALQFDPHARELAVDEAGTGVGKSRAH